ncbi:phenylacetate--CoA ligase family protein [Algoriphagus lacus]|uniref:Phenylacetate--CoA ligase family protein n=1 Tax=Algoriphagus lacus TaxID=2056311 RepID=A0A418PMG2_9BACT|nr:phenylacetate--CoA ligase family protein [Algoriphagus lacus]RIW12252.1 phenylacetate--CoA ligase family protein [Algoriphagus lacus]
MKLNPFFLENILLPLGDTILGSSFISSLKSWREIFGRNTSEIEKLQAAKLRKLLEFAGKNSPYYRLQNIPSHRDPYVWLKSFPVLPKRTFRENLEYILTQPVDGKLTAVMSSGSTGPPSKVYFSKAELSSTRALQIIWWEWAGYRFGNSLLQTGVNMKRSREKAIKDKLLNTRYIDAMSHSEAQILEELNLLRKEPRDHFVAYASSLYLFAKTALAHEIRDVKFRSAISLGEKLLPQFREAIEKAFSCKVYDTYGASEGFLIASQCHEGKYHLMTPHVVVEILDEKSKEVQPGQTGRVVLTGLDNFTTPMIRYEVGDLAVKGKPGTCSCGLELPVLDEIIGRLTEFLLTPSGKFITVQTVVRVLKHFPEIEQFKVIQKEFDLYRLIYISPKNQLDVREEGVQRMFEEVFGEPLRFEFEKVTELPKAKTGKFQLIENQYRPI